MAALILKVSRIHFIGRGIDEVVPDLRNHGGIENKYLRPNGRMRPNWMLVYFERIGCWDPTEDHPIELLQSP